ncbi:MAG: hypothetical protein EOP48_18405, partial [Sphingobacteriales bacterium]
MSYSFSNTGVTNAKLTGQMTLEEMVSTIKDHPEKDRIQQLHKLKYGSPEYDTLKSKFPYVMPHGIFSNGRKKADFLDTTGTLYYDVDSANIPDGNIDAMKEMILQRHRDQICLLGRSVGNRGLFLYIRLENPEVLNIHNFDAVHEHVRTHILQDVPTDACAKGIARPHIIPYDPNLYYAPVASLRIDLVSIPEVRKGIITSNYNTVTNGYRGDDTFLPISEVRNRIKTRTHVDLKGKDILVEDLPYCDLFIPHFVADGAKHKTYRAMVNGILLNNSSLEVPFVLGYINYVNLYRTGGKPMQTREMINTVIHEYNRIMSGGRIKAKIKRYHTDPCLGKIKRLQLVAKTRGSEIKTRSISLIKDAVKELEKREEKVTQSNVLALLGGKLKEATIKRHWRDVVPKTKEEN